MCIRMEIIVLNIAKEHEGQHRLMVVSCAAKKDQVGQLFLG